MRFNINKRAAALAAANALSLAGFLAFSLIGSSAADSQKYNRAAERWQNGDDSAYYTQVSCFMSESAGFSTDSLGSVRVSLLNALQTISVAPEEGKKLCPDAYSAPVGKAIVSGDIIGRSEAEITAVGGDFFMMHGFELLDGAFFTDDDLMQDGAVIDRSLAWELYGSYEVSGMKLNINGTQYYISGVIEDPETDEEKKCAGELPRAYISYDGASGFASAGGYSDAFGMDPDMGGGDFSAITCYEVLMPDPVEGYAYSSVKQAMEGWGDNVSVVQNTGRFDPFKRLKALKKISSAVVRDNEIAYPYWENASRIVQFRLSYIYLCAALCLIIPSLTLIWLAVKAFKALKRNKQRIFRAVSSLFRRIKEKGRKINEGQKN